MGEGGDRYPNRPGWRRNATGPTSREAAEAVTPHAPTQARLCLDVIEARGAASCEEIVAHLAEAGRKVLLSSVRGRCAELNKLGKVKPSGLFGKGESGRVRSHRWALVPQAERQVGEGATP